MWHYTHLYVNEFIFYVSFDAFKMFNFKGRDLIIPNYIFN